MKQNKINVARNIDFISQLLFFSRTHINETKQTKCGEKRFVLFQRPAHLE